LPLVPPCTPTPFGATIPEQRAPAASPGAGPRARRLAKELSVDWERLSGTGRTGRITEEDVRAAAAAASLPESTIHDSADVQRMPMSPIRRAIAERLSRRPGAALIIDYGHEQSAAGDTLQAVKAHEFHAPLEDPGDADLTTHVDFAELCRVATEAGAQIHGPVSQGAFLQALGIGVRADALIKASPSHRQDIGQALSRLTSDDGMGRLFKVLALVSPGMPPPPGFD